MVQDISSINDTEKVALRKVIFQFKQILPIVFTLSLFWVACAEIYKNNLGSTEYVLNNQMPVGGDFIAFYVAGKILQKDTSKLYDVSHQLSLQKALLGSELAKKHQLPFIYPPLVAYLFAPLSYVSFKSAYYLWTGVSFILVLASILLISKTLEQSPMCFIRNVTLALGFFPLTMFTFAGGQLSSIGLLIFSIVFFLLKHQKDFLAGVVFSLSYYKPPLFLLFLIYQLIKRQRRFVIGFFCGGILIIFITILMVGYANFFDYIILARGYSYGSEFAGLIRMTPEKGVGLYSLLFRIQGVNNMLIGNMSYLLCMALSILVLLRLQPSTITYPHLVKSREDMLFYGLLVSYSLFLSLQLITYDLTILILPILVVIDSIAQPNMRKSIKFIGSVSIIILYISWYFCAQPKNDWSFIPMAMGLVIWLVAYSFLIAMMARNKNHGKHDPVEVLEQV
ncbi:MAG: DUF2029 domain-containing protein [Deltaproteobacteria bacterium]|nr:DUF2029 domain-containing protein [Deltaproteobacteria bacterium]